MKDLRFVSAKAAVLLALVLLTACGQQETDSSAAQVQSSSQSSDLVSSSRSSQSSPSESGVLADLAEESGLDGIYHASQEGESLTLELAGRQGTLTRIDAAGQQLSEPVILDSVNQSMTVGEDVKRYRLEADLLVLEDLSQEASDDATLYFQKD